ncbi:MAG TPA: ABC transporter permease [Limnochordales bacterium]
MTRYIVVRLLQLAPILLGVSVLVFLMIHLVPGDAVDIMMGTQVARTEAQVQELRRLLGLDQPLYVQYWDWLSRALRGDLGVSLRSARPVAEEIAARLPLSAQLTVMTLALAVLAGVPLGIFSAVRHNTPADSLLRILGLIGLSIPDFWLATMMVLFASLYWPVIHLGQYVPFWTDPAQNLKVMLPPAIAFSSGLIAIVMRFTRSSVLEVLGAEYVRTARAKGLHEGIVLGKHVLRNALVPVVTVLGFYAGYLLGGTVVIEEVFALPGMGRLALNAIAQRDYPMIQGIVLVVATLFVLVNLAVDVLYAILNPRIRYD